MSAREQRHAERIAELRRQQPTLPDRVWEDMTEKQRLRWQIDDLHHGIAALSGRYSFYAQQDPSNTRLAELVAALSMLLETGVLPEAGVVPT